MTNFDKLNKETRDYNNGLTRSIDPTSKNNCRMKASELLANANNGEFPKKMY